MNHKILFLIFMLFFVNIVSADIEIAYVSNDTYVDEALPDSNLASNTALRFNPFTSEHTWIYLELPSNHSDTTLHLYCNNGGGACIGVTINIYNTTAFNYSNITWNTKTSSFELIRTYTLTDTISNITLNSTSNYIMINTTSNGRFYSYDNILTYRPYIFYSVPDAPLITSYSNNFTNDESSTVQLLNTSTVNFNVTSDQTITSYNWTLNDISQSNNYNNLSINFIEGSNYKLEVDVTSDNGTSDTLTWNIYNFHLNTITFVTSNSLVWSNTTGFQLNEQQINTGGSTGFLSGKFTLEQELDIYLRINSRRCTSGTSVDTSSVLIDDVSYFTLPDWSPTGQFQTPPLSSSYYTFNNVSAGVHTIKIAGLSSPGTSAWCAWNLNLVPFVNIDNVTQEDTFTASGIITYADRNINSTTYPLNNSLIFIDAAHYTYSNGLGEYSLNTTNGSHTVLVSKIGFGTLTSTIDTTLQNNNYTLNFSQPFMTLPHIEIGNKILSEYNNTEYPLNLWNSPNFVWGVYRFTEFNGTDKDIDYYKPCNLESDNAFGCELVLNKDYKFKVMYSDLYNYNLGIYHPFLTGSRNFTTGEITISKDYIQIDSIKVISSLPQAQRETTFKGYFWEAIFWMFIILLLGFILTGGRNKYGHR